MRVGDSTPRTSLRGWLRFRFLAVTKQYFRDIKKTRLFASSFHGDVADTLLLSQPPDPAGQQELRGALQVCLDKLPETQRQAIMSRHNYNQEAAETSSSELQSANPNTERVWVFRGLTALQRCLQARGIVA